MKQINSVPAKTSTSRLRLAEPSPKQGLTPGHQEKSVFNGQFLRYAVLSGFSHSFANVDKN